MACSEQRLRLGDLRRQETAVTWLGGTGGRRGRRRGSVANKEKKMGGLVTGGLHSKKRKIFKNFTKIIIIIGKKHVILKDTHRIFEKEKKSSESY